MSLIKSKTSYKSKKGAFEPLMYVILGIIVIVIVSVASSGPLWASVKDIFKFTKEKTNISAEFTPYTPSLSGEDINVDNSMKALVYAINGVASETPSASDQAAFGDSTVECVKDKCTVKNFFLPQQTQGFEFTSPSTWLAGYGDPRWLVYYESLQDGVDTYWHTDGSSIFNMMSMGFIVAGGVMNIIPWGARLGKAPAKEAINNELKMATKELGEAVLKSGGKEIIERVAKNGPTNAIRAMFVEDGLKNIYGIGDEISKEITEKVLTVAGKKGGAETFEKELRSGLESSISESLKKVTQKPDNYVGSIEDYRKFILKDIMDGEGLMVGQSHMIVSFADGQEVKGLKGIFSQSVSKSMQKEIFSKRFTEDFFRQFLKQGADGFVFDSTLFKETAEKAVASLDAMTPSIRETALQKAAKTLDGLLGDTVGTLESGTLKGTIGLTPDELAKQLIQDPLRHPYKALVAQVKFMGAQSPIKFAKISGLDVSTLGITWLAKSSVKSLASLPKWVLDHKYGVMILVVLAAQEADAMNEKKLPVGDNALGLNQPYLFGVTKAYQLSSAARKYFIALEDTDWINELKGRLYLVSPCKADLVVIKTKCTCYANPALNQYNFGGGLQDVKANTIQINTDLYDSEDIYKQQAIKTLYEQIITNPFAALSGAETNWWTRTTHFTARGVRVNDYSIKSFEIMDKYYDTTEAVKECPQKTAVSGAVDWMSMNKDIVKAIMNGKVSKVNWQVEAGSTEKTGVPLLPGLQLSVAAEIDDSDIQNFYNSPQYQLDCINVQVEKQDYKDNSNYCYDTFPKTEFIRNAISLAQVGVDVWVTGAIAAFAKETAGTSLVIGTVAMVGSGMAFGVVDEWIAHMEKWP